MCEKHALLVGQVMCSLEDNWEATDSEKKKKKECNQIVIIT